MQEVSQVCFEQQSVPVLLTPIWSIYSTNGIHAADENCSKFHQKTRPKSSPVSGRLADLPHLTGSVSTQPVDSLGGSNKARPITEPRQVRLVPQQRFEFIGMYFLSDLGIVRVPPDRVANIVSLLSVIVRETHVKSTQVSLAPRYSQCGSGLCGIGQVASSPIAVNSALPMETTGTTAPPRDQARHDRFPSPIALVAGPQRLTRGVPMHDPAPQLHLYTDSSRYGWGAHLEPQGSICRGTWSQDQLQYHINMLELKAVSLAIHQLLPLLKGKCVMVATRQLDSCCYIRKQGGTHSLTLFRETWELLTFCHRNSITLRVRHIPGRLNVIADSLSRGTTIPTEWSINPLVTQKLFSLWGTPTMDLFSTRYNNKLPQFVSPVPDHRAVAVDALAMDWMDLFALCIPSDETNATGPSKGQNIQCQDHFGCTIMAPDVMVQRPARSTSRLSKVHPPASKAVNSEQSIAQQTRHIQPSRLEIGQEFNQKGKVFC